MIKFIYCGLIASIMIFGGNVLAEELDAGQILKEITQKGAKLVIAEYWMTEDYDKSEQLVNAISTGTKEWLEVARLLKSESDAAVSEDLFFALSLALHKNPIGVLSLIKTQPRKSQPNDFFIDWICRDPYLEDAVDLATEIKFLKDTEKALVCMYDPTHDKEIDVLRWQCLESIRRDLKIVVHDKDQSAVPE